MLYRVSLATVPRGAGLVCLLVGGVAACGETPVASVDASAAREGGPLLEGAPCVYCTPSCASPSEAPLRTPDGGTVCTRVGAAPRPIMGAWPPAEGAPSTVVYVGSAMGPRTPSGDAPQPDLASALRSRPTTILLGVGTFTLAETVSLPASVTIRGMGSDQTTLVAPPGGDALVVGPSGGVVALEGFSIRFGVRGDAGTSVGIRARGATVTVNLRDVVVSGANEGIRAESATLCAEGLTVREAELVGITLTDGAHGYLRSVVVRDGLGVGVLSRRSHLSYDTGLVANNSVSGVVLQGTLSSVGSCTADSDCAPLPGCLGFQERRVCETSLPLAETRLPDGGLEHRAIDAESRCRSVSELANVAMIRNQVIGLRAERTALLPSDPTDYESRMRLLGAPGPNVRVVHTIIAGTSSPTDAGVGYGVYVGPTSTVSFDPDLVGEDRMALGSAIVDNARAGVLVDGDPNGPDGGFVVGDAALPEALVRAGTLWMSGALVGSNRGPGVFVQRRALAERIAYSRLADNAIMGFGAGSSGRLALGQCNEFIGTRVATFRASAPGAAPFRTGDGVGLSDPTPGLPERWRASATRPTIETAFEDSLFSNNGRGGITFFGGVVYFRSVRPAVGNRGDGNDWGVGVYNEGRKDGVTDRILGFRPPPPGVTGSPNDFAQTTR